MQDRKAGETVLEPVSESKVIDECSRPSVVTEATDIGYAQRGLEEESSAKRVSEEDPEEMTPSVKEIYELFGIEPKTFIDPTDDVDRKIVEM